jgi:glycosyltransferase involved in cell wall biosynthesis
MSTEESVIDQKKVPQVSIGMPVYNGAEFIRNAIDSLLAQTFSEFELIISDNASDDDTEAICNEYAQRDCRIRYIRQNENMGIAANFQFVLDNSDGHYFMWAAADDVWDATWIEKMLPISMTNNCLAYGFVQTINERGERTCHQANGRKFEYSGSRIARRIKFFIEPGVWGKANLIHGIFPSSYLRQLGDIWTCRQSDLLFLYSVLQRLEIRHGGGATHFKRIHGNSLGEKIKPQNTPSSLVSRIESMIRQSFAGLMLRQYIKLSSVVEACAILLVFPLPATYVIASIVKHKIYRIIYSIN